VGEAERRLPSDRTARADPDHSILSAPWKYRVVGFSFVEPHDGEPYVDLVLRKDDLVRRLRFPGPREIEIEKGFPSPTWGICIRDVRARGMEGIGVRLTDFEASPGRVSLWARTVIDLDAEDSTAA
jgi:hypothetical protein